MNATQQMQLAHTSLDTEFETLSLLATTRNVVEFLRGPSRHPSSSAEIATSKSIPHGPGSTAAAPLVLDATAVWRTGGPAPSGTAEFLVTATALGQGRAFAGTVTFSELPRKVESCGPDATPALSEWGPRALARRSESTDSPIDGQAVTSSRDVRLALPLLSTERGCCGIGAPRTRPQTASFDTETVCDAFLCPRPLKLSWSLCRTLLVARSTHGRFSSPTRCVALLLSVLPQELWKLELMNASTSVSQSSHRKNPGSISTEAVLAH